MPLQYDVLQILVDPNVAFLLLLVGMVGIALEVFSPGAIIPGATGAISLLLGLIGSAQLPVEAIGVVLLIVAFALIVAEAHLPTGGVLGAVGVVALIAGGLLLFDDDGGSRDQPGAGGRGRPDPRRADRADREEGADGPPPAGCAPARRTSSARPGWCATTLDPVGQVFVAGALWRARVGDGEGPVVAGYRVRVEAIDGLTLSVAPLEPEGS